MIANKTIKVTDKTFKWIEENRGGVPKTKFLEMYLVDNKRVKVEEFKHEHKGKTKEQ